MQQSKVSSAVSSTAEVVQKTNQKTQKTHESAMCKCGGWLGGRLWEGARLVTMGVAGW